MRGGVLCSGNLVLDILVRPVDRPVWGSTLRVESISQHLGGNGGNTSYTLAKLGAPVRTLGMVGRDAFGETVLDRLRAAGVDTSFIGRSEAPTSTTAGLIDSRGNRMFLQLLGSSAEMFAGSPAFPDGAPQGMSHYHMASPFGLPKLRARMREVLQAAEQAGLTTSLDTMWDVLGRWMEDLAPCLPHVGILFVNEDEARELTGADTASGAARRLRAQGARDVVVKLGSNGCAVFHGGESFHCPAFEIEAVDSTGAGDCFAGGFLAALQRGLSYHEAARLACAAGALNVRVMGGTEGVLAFEETLAWMAGARTRAIEPDVLRRGNSGVMAPGK
jgi:sugar/nucleoside kinase (ribokinase family)